MKNFGLISLFLLISLAGCIDNDLPDTSAQLAIDIQKIEKYLQDNNITDYVKDPSGVFYVIHQIGSGKMPATNDYVNMTYVAKLFNGSIAFEQTTVPVFLTLRYISVSGLKIAIPNFPEGTIATVYIPSVLAYGGSSSAEIPANSNVIFEVEIVNVASTEPEILEAQATTIDQYVLENEIEGVQVDPSGLRYIIHEEGTGDSPTINNSVTVKYKGTLLSTGEKFDEATTMVTFQLSGLIEGWRIGFPLLKEGSKATFYIPSGLGYGIQGNQSIPPHAILVFEVELIEVL